MSIKNKEKLKFGLLGLGTVVRIRVANLLKNELKKKIKVTAVYDKDKNKNIEYCKKFNCTPSKNENDFFLKDFKYCYISTPSGSHYNDILNCFKKNKHVVVEKPPVLKTNELIKLDKIAKNKKLKFFVIYQNRENRAVKFVKNFLNKEKKDKKILANLNLFWSRPQKYYSGWHGKWKHDGGVISQQGIHYIDLLCHFFGKPIKAISIISNISNKLEAEDTHIGVVKFKNVTCTIGLSTALKKSDFKASIEIISQKRSVTLHGVACNKLKIVNFDRINKKLEILCKKNSQNVVNGVGVSHKACFEKIIKNFYNKSFKALSAIDTLDTLKLINMFYLSSSKKKWILNNRKNISSRLGN